MCRRDDGCNIREYDQNGGRVCDCDKIAIVERIEDCICRNEVAVVYGLNNEGRSPDSGTSTVRT